MIDYVIQKAYALDPVKLPSVPGDQTEIDIPKILTMIMEVIKLLLDFAGIVCLILLFYAALQYAVAYGDESKVETAKKTIIWALVGLLMVALAATFVYVLRDQLKP